MTSCNDDVIQRYMLQKISNDAVQTKEHVKPNLFSLKCLLNSMSAAIISVLLSSCSVSTLASSPGISSSAPVSYTHLDVYKRQTQDGLYFVKFRFSDEL